MYESPADTTAHECDNCGALLPAADATGRRTCTFCKAVYEPAPKPTPDAPTQINLVIAGKPVSDIDFTKAASTSAKGCGWVSILILVIVVASVGLPLYFAFKGGAFDELTSSITGKTDYDFGPDMAVLPGEPSATPSLVILDSQYDQAAAKAIQRVKRFNGGSGDAVWTSPGLPDNDPSAPILADATNAYVASKSKVVAYKLSDGTAAWQGSLSDDYNGNACPDCFTVMGPRVIVRSADGTLQAFDTTTGAPAWSKRLEDVNAKVVRVGDVLAVRDGSGGTYTLETIEPVGGTTVATMAPACTRPDSSYTSDLDSSTILRSSPAGDALIVALGTSPWCVQGWDPHTGGMGWNVYTDDGVYFHDDDFRLVDGPAGLAITAGDTIGIIDPTRTSWRTILKADQTTFRPVAATADLIYVEAVNSRGTTKSDVRAIGIASGEQRFSFSTGKAKPIDGEQGVFGSYGTSGDGTFSAHVADGRLFILTFTEGSSYDHTLATDSIDATTGAAGPHQSFPANSHSLIPDFGPVLWNGSKATARVGDDTIQTIDVSTGAVVNRIG